MADNQSGWDALFNPDDELESEVGGRSRSPGAAGASLEKYMQLPGVRGAIQVTLDGVVLNQFVPGDVQYYASLTASIGSTARQVDGMLEMDGFEYAVVRTSDDIHSIMIFLEKDSFVGLLLSGEIAPTHIIARLRDPGSGRSG